MSDSVQQLENRFLELYFARRPYVAGQLGCRWGRGSTPPSGPDRAAALLAAFDDLAHRVAQAPPADSAEDRLTVALIAELSGYERTSLRSNWSRFTVAPLPEVGLAAATLIFLPYSVVTTEADQDLFLRSCAGIADTLEGGSADLALGRADGRTPVARLVSSAAGQIRQYLATSAADDPYLSALRRAGAAPARIAELEAVLRQRVRPAFGRYLDDLDRAVLPTARDDEHAGVCWLPGGVSLYRDSAREHTTLDVDPEHLHEVGLAQVRQLRAEAEDIGAALGWGMDFPVIRDRLRSDRGLFFDSGPQILSAARAALVRAETVVSQWITDPPSARCEVREMNALEAAHGVIGHYETAPLDRSSPGVYWVNTSDPAGRPRYEAEALAFHESIPGHHLEMATTQESVHSCELRSLVQIMPYTEGWGLYAERLADEVGLYSDEVSRLGMVSFGLWRAGRLVVDSGLHRWGWSRRRAVDYLWDNTILTRSNIENEVDRYLAYPGSSLAYAVGRLAIGQLRDASGTDVRSPGEMRAFHDRLLRTGPLTLRLLGAELGVRIDV